MEPKHSPAVPVNRTRTAEDTPPGGGTAAVAGTAEEGRRGEAGPEEAEGGAMSDNENHTREKVAARAQQLRRVMRDRVTPAVLAKVAAGLEAMARAGSRSAAKMLDRYRRAGLLPDPPAADPAGESPAG
jgi:hypothetical protein